MHIHFLNPNKQQIISSFLINSIFNVLSNYKIPKSNRQNQRESILILVASISNSRWFLF